MGLFSKKKDAEAPAEEPMRHPSDDANWRAWYNIGNDYCREGKFEKACNCWVEAMDRFDDSSKQLTKVHDDIFDCTSSYMDKCAEDGTVVPTQMLAEIDLERRLKHSGLEWSDLSEDVFYFAKEKYQDAKGPQHAVMLYISAAYSILGYLRYSGDLREMSSKCDEVVRLGNEIGKCCADFPRFKYIGGIKPAMAKEFAGFVADYFMKLQSVLDANIKDMGEEELAAVDSYRKEHPDDQIDVLVEALNTCLNGHAHLVKPKSQKSLDSLFGEYVAAVRKTC